MRLRYLVLSSIILLALGSATIYYQFKNEQEPSQVAQIKVIYQTPSQDDLDYEGDLEDMEDE